MKAAFDAARATVKEIASWLKASPAGKSVPTGTLNNYLYGRREMPREMRQLLAKALKKQARRLERAARRLEKAGD